MIKSYVHKVKGGHTGGEWLYGPFDSHSEAVDWVEQQETNLEEDGVDLGEWYEDNHFEVVTHHKALTIKQRFWPNLGL